MRNGSENIFRLEAKKRVFFRNPKFHMWNETIRCEKNRIETIWSEIYRRPGMVFLSRLYCPTSCPDYPRLSCHGCLVQFVRSQLSCPDYPAPGYPLLAVLPWLSCPGYTVPAVLSRLYYPGCPLLAVLPWLSCLGYTVPAVLSRLYILPRLSCHGCPVQVLLSQLSCSDYPALAVLSWLSCHGCPVLSRSEITKNNETGAPYLQAHVCVANIYAVISKIMLSFLMN